MIIDLVNKIIYEDKSATKLYMDNPDFPQTEADWAYKQIYKKGSNRINALQQESFTLSGADSLPDTQLIKEIKNYVFRIDADMPGLRAEVQAEFDKSKIDIILKEITSLLSWADINLIEEDLAYMKERLENLQKILPTAFDDDKTILYIF